MKSLILVALKSLLASRLLLPMAQVLLPVPVGVPLVRWPTFKLVSLALAIVPHRFMLVAFRC